MIQMKTAAFSVKMVPQMRRLFFCQNVQNECRQPIGYQAGFEPNDGKRVPQWHFLRAQQMCCPEP